MILKATKSLRLSLLLSLFEFLIFLVMVLLSSSISDGQWVRLDIKPVIMNINTSFSSFLILIVTTWYVVFTYYLLKTTQEMNQQLLNPFLKINWNVIQEKPSNIISTDYTDIIGDGENSNWLILEIENTRPKPAQNISFEIELSGYSNAYTLKNKVLRYSNKAIRLNSNEKLFIGIANLSQIQKDISLSFKIVKFLYSPIDSENELSEITGQNPLQINGFGVIVPTVSGQGA